MPDPVMLALQKLGFVSGPQAWIIDAMLRKSTGLPLDFAERDEMEGRVQAQMLVFFDEQYKRLARLLRDNGKPDWDNEEEWITNVLFPELSAAHQMGALMGGLGVGGVGIDWNLVNEDAVAWARKHAVQVSEQITGTTEKRYVELSQEVSDQIADWIQEGDPLPKLTKALAEKMPAERAEMVASTEVTRAYAESNMEVWKASGEVEGSEWRTAMDEIVCPICGSDTGLEGQRAKLGETFVNRAGTDSGITNPPAHVRCRCWIVPVLIPLPGEAPNAL